MWEKRGGFDAVDEQHKQKLTDQRKEIIPDVYSQLENKVIYQHLTSINNIDKKLGLGLSNLENVVQSLRKLDSLQKQLDALKKESIELLTFKETYGSIIDRFQKSLTGIQKFLKKPITRLEDMLLKYEEHIHNLTVQQNKHSQDIKFANTYKHIIRNNTPQVIQNSLDFDRKYRTIIRNIQPEKLQQDIENSTNWEQLNIKDVKQNNTAITFYNEYKNLPSEHKQAKKGNDNWNNITSKSDMSAILNALEPPFEQNTTISRKIAQIQQALNNDFYQKQTEYFNEFHSDLKSGTDLKRIKQHSGLWEQLINADEFEQLYELVFNNLTEDDLKKTMTKLLRAKGKNITKLKEIL